MLHDWLGGELCDQQEPNKIHFLGGQKKQQNKPTKKPSSFRGLHVMEANSKNFIPVFLICQSGFSATGKSLQK